MFTAWKLGNRWRQAAGELGEYSLERAEYPVPAESPGDRVNAEHYAGRTAGDQLARHYPEDPRIRRVVAVIAHHEVLVGAQFHRRDGPLRFDHVGGQDDRVPAATKILDPCHPAHPLVGVKARQ